MSDLFNNFGGGDPSIEIIRRNVAEHGQNGHHDQSQYFGIMMLASLASRVIGMYGQHSNTKKEDVHHQDIKKIKDYYEDKRFQAQLSDIQASHELMLKHETELARIQFSNMMTLDSYKIFLSTWCAKFKLTPTVFFEKLENTSNLSGKVLKPIVLIPRTEIVNSIYGDYTKFCDMFAERFQHTLTQVDFSCRTMWKYNSPNICSSPKCDSFILHFILQGLPTIIVYPILKNDKLIFILATWASSISQNFFYKKVFEIQNGDNINATFIADIVGVITAYTADCFTSFYANHSASSLQQLRSFKLVDNAKKLLKKYINDFSEAHKFYSNLGIISNTKI